MPRPLGESTSRCFNANKAGPCSRSSEISLRPYGSFPSDILSTMTTMQTTVDRAGVAPAAMQLLDGDLDERLFERALRAPVIACDTETTALDWREGRLATFQVQLDDLAVIVRLNGAVPRRLKAIVEDPSILKIMHHAMFDLRFIVRYWDAAPANFACTKIASKLVHPEAEPREHSLASLVARYFGVELDKSQRVTNWAASDLSTDQLQYAAQDVRYLWPLYECLDREIRAAGLISLRDRCYAHLATRVELDLRG